MIKKQEWEFYQNNYYDRDFYEDERLEKRNSINDLDSIEIDRPWQIMVMITGVNK